MLKQLTSLITILTLVAYTAHAQAKLKVIKTFHIASPGGWDYLSINDDKLYVSHGTQVNILNKTTGDSIGVVENTTGVHGIAFIPAIGRGYTSNGRLNNVSVFDLKTNEVLQQIATGQNPDAIMYEPFTKSIITCNGRSNDLSIIDPETNAITATIAVGGKPEEAASNGEGILYVNLEDKNEIAVVDLKTMKVTNRFSLKGAEGPTGLGYDKLTKRLFAGCEKKLVILNAESGEIVQTLPIGDGCDGVAFDAAAKIIYTSNGEGTITVIKVLSANKFAIVENAPSLPRGRTIALDPSTHMVYVPTAGFEPLPANAAKNERPKMIPGSFKVLVLAEQGK